MATETHEAATSVCLNDHGGAVGMPQLCGEWMGNQVFWLVVTLVVIFFVLSKIALPRIASVLAERAGTITNDLAAAEEEVINPLAMRAMDRAGKLHEALAINEVSLLRAGPQAAKLRITVDGRLRLAELVCDGALLATPAGSTAYNYSAHGPILPIGADVLALTAIAAFRPRRWRGALLPKTARVRFDAVEADKRPVMADADSISIDDIDWVEIRSEPDIRHRILFDPGHGLEERLIAEQFN